MSKKLESQLNTTEMTELCTALADINDAKAIANLLRDLLTLDELAEASRRFNVAKRLASGQTQRSIYADTGVSTATVSRVNYWLHHGTGGYRTALKRLH